ncbi:MAG TPA: hypothetical protein VLD67_07820 [Vicinamibacterales bacterium]|nr:hypothetical protein [Vicinamibacterales bacterium]
MSNDVLLLSADWPSRALLRAQLIESGFEVFATDSWESARQELLRGGLPRAFVLDLHGLADAGGVVRELATLMSSGGVLLLGAADARAPDPPAPGWRVLSRPIRIGAVAGAVARMLAAACARPAPDQDGGTD